MSSYQTIKGDTWDSISRKATGTEAQAGTIKAANPGIMEPIQAGLQITIPDQPPVIVAPAATLPSNELSLSLSGSRFRYWTEITVSHFFDSLDSIAFTAPFEPDNTGFKNLFKPLTFQPAEVFIGNEQLFSGTVISIDPDLKSDSNTVSVTAYSRAGVLMDCHPPASMLPIEFKNVTLDIIAGSLLASFGINYVFEASPGGPFRRVRIEPTKSIFSSLADLAVQRNLYMSNDGPGVLIFKTAAADGAPVASLDARLSPVTGVTPEIDPQMYFSEITGFRGAKSGREGNQYTVKNSLLKNVLRPYNFKAQDIKRSELEGAVTGKLARMLGNFIKYTVTVDTWRDKAGSIWTPGTFVNLIAPRAMIYNDYRFFIRTVTLYRKKDSETAALGVTLPGAFSGQLPSRLPWD